MPETKRVDPLGWFFSACCTLLLGVLALTLAVHLLQVIWVWLVTGIGIVVGLAVLIQLLLWWHGRRPW